MNKTLIIEHLYDVFQNILVNNRDPRLLFNDLFSNDDFINMLLNRPFNITNILSVIQKGKVLKVDISNNAIRYLSFLIAEFIVTTDINVAKIRDYIDPFDVIKNFNYYHSQDVDNVIFLLINEYNRKRKLRKANKHIFLNEDLLVKNFLRLYPIKKYKNFTPIYDTKLLQRLYVIDNEILLLNSDLEKMLVDNYFIQRYCIGNKVYCFTNKEPSFIKNSSVHIFVVDDFGITYIENSGEKIDFLFSN